MGVSMCMCACVHTCVHVCGEEECFFSPIHSTNCFTWLVVFRKQRAGSDMLKCRARTLTRWEWEENADCSRRGHITIPTWPYNTLLPSIPRISPVKNKSLLEVASLFVGLAAPKNQSEGWFGAQRNGHGFESSPLWPLLVQKFINSRISKGRKAS